MLIFFILIFILVYSFYRYIFPLTKINPCGKYVLISGCDTGIGHETAIKLDKEGFHVFAGVLLPTNITALESKLSSRATVFLLDITQQDDIDRAFHWIRAKTATLHGLVNNAGILTHGSVDWTSMEMTRLMMNVNFFGHVAMTKTFLPLLISKSDCRVVNVVTYQQQVSFHFRIHQRTQHRNMQ
jgi:NAD(P)-dependent dehydrogenase (short-subunit alcohol dehydrogenase family)